MDTLDSISPSFPPGTRIYKDECMFNFDTPENNPSGLDICLHCFQAFSRPEYTDQHHHKHFLNLKKTLKSQNRDASGESAPKIAKLEVKDIPESELYDISYAIYSSESQESIPLDAAPQNVITLADAIIKSNSSAKDDEIKVWELDIQPCEHSFTLVQDPVNFDLTKCLECDLMENLWLCLGCGIVGCGREQYGLTLKGNSHMVAHYEATNHPVALKLGSLDADNYDAYCYKCNDEVKVPEIAEKLAVYGINLATFIKTEKNLAELNLDQNLNWDFKLEGVDGQLKPLFGPGFTGFKNLGNSCYLNSAIQAIFLLKEYRKLFEGKTFPSGVEDPARDLPTQIIKVFKGLTSGKYAVPSSVDGGYQAGIKPAMFKTLLGEGHPEFALMKQQDAFEFLLYYLEKLAQKLGNEVNEPFQFLIENKLTCRSCKGARITTEMVDNLAVPLDIEVENVDAEGKKQYKEIKLLDLINQFTATENLKDFSCPNCSNKDQMLKLIKFKSFPNVLLVNAKRIVLENWVPVKVDVPIEIPDKLNLESFKASGLLDGEFLIKDEEELGRFTPNADALQTLLDMGFPEGRSIRALHATGNQSSEMAMNWVFEHMDDTNIDAPLSEEEIASKGKSVEVLAEQVGNFVSMGFSEKLAKKALFVTKGDQEAAVEWLFNNPDDNGEIIDDSAEKTEVSYEKLEQNTWPKFKLQGVICHKGTSPHTGHYVVFLKKIVDGEEKWVLFNDEKVVECDGDLQDIITNGYVYIFEADREDL